MPSRASSFLRSTWTTSLFGVRSYELIRTVDISPILAVLPGLTFTAVNTSSTDPAKSPCSVVLGPLPQVIADTVAGLGLGGESKRLLLRKLAARQGMAPHVDQFLAAEADWRRFQLPLVTHESVRMRWPELDEEIHLAAGFLYEVRFDRLHEVVNGWDGERIHLQIDQVGATI